MDSNALQKSLSGYLFDQEDVKVIDTSQASLYGKLWLNMSMNLSFGSTQDGERRRSRWVYGYWNKSIALAGLCKPKLQAEEMKSWLADGAGLKNKIWPKKHDIQHCEKKKLEKHEYWFNQTHRIFIILVNGTTFLLFIPSYITSPRMIIVVYQYPNYFQ